MIAEVPDVAKLGSAFAALLRVSPETLRVLAARVDATGADPGEEARARAALRELVDHIADDLESARTLLNVAIIAALPSSEALVDASVRLEECATGLRHEAEDVEGREGGMVDASRCRAEADRLDDISRWLDELRLRRGDT